MTDLLRMGQPIDDQPLAHQQVVVAGQLASMSKCEALRLIRALGGRLGRRATRRTSLMVLGRRGLPLSSQGDLSTNLAHSVALSREGACIRTVSEEEFLAEIGLSGDDRQVHRLYTSQELVSLLGVSRQSLRSWLRAKLIEPVERFHSLEYFDLVQVSAAKKLMQLAHANISTQRIRRSLEQLSQWLPDMQSPLLQLQILERNGDLVFRTASGSLAEPEGQLQMDFSEPVVASVQFCNTPRSAADWFEHGCECEDADDFAEAAEAFRQSLLIGGPDADTVFNLANVLFAQGHKGEAAERFRQAVEIAPTFVDAWNNLGVVLAELKQCEQALWAYRKAIELDKDYADAHYNLAECLAENGCLDDAQEHWQTYLQHDSQSQWASHARHRLKNLGRMDRAK